MRKKSKKYKYPLLALALVLGLGIGILVIPALKDRIVPVKPVETVMAPDTSDNPTASSAELVDEKNWTVYKVDEYHFSFKYPKGFVTNVFNEPNQHIDLFAGIDFGRRKMPVGTLYQKDLAELGYTISVAIDRTKSLKDLTTELDAYKSRKEFSKKDIQIQNVSGYRYEGIGEDSIRSVVVFEKDKRTFIFTLLRYVESGPLSDEGKDIFERMVSSVTL